MHKRYYDTDAHRLLTMAAGALLADLLGVSRKQARSVLRCLRAEGKVEHDDAGAYSREGLVQAAERILRH
jgi:DNA-binding GntR family transcriptional regulator